MSMILVTHNLGVVAGRTDEIAGHVWRPHRRTRPDRGGLSAPAPSLHRGAAVGDTAHGPARPHAAADHSGPAAGHAASMPGCPFAPALPGGGGALPSSHAADDGERPTVATASPATCRCSGWRRSSGIRRGRPREERTEWSAGAWHDRSCRRSTPRRSPLTCRDDALLKVRDLAVNFQPRRQDHSQRSKASPSTWRAAKRSDLSASPAAARPRSAERFCVYCRGEIRGRRGRSIYGGCELDSLSKARDARYARALADDLPGPAVVVQPAPEGRGHRRRRAWRSRVLARRRRRRRIDAALADVGMSRSMVEGAGRTSSPAASASASPSPAPWRSDPS